ncbi:hypothetical protein QP446_10005 [Corynebacterium riegelii]|uniref:hypothetical protein n=1 Tax=Corynebacterium riegelii TaxID=156976 RepID=UPI00254D2A0B|nr:hypothetical protein [Corynebacterium riegelii]MDK7181087.1 hypothetical protein [Corynebacterium riegelii]
MRFSTSRAAACLAAAAVFASTLASPAVAAEPALAAPGAPMRIMPKNPPATVKNGYGDDVKVPSSFFTYVCSQGPSGTIRHLDGSEQKVMLTASHCITPLPNLPDMTDQVQVNVGGAYQPIGVRGRANYVPPAAMNLDDPVATYNTADWGFVLIDAGVNPTHVSQSKTSTGEGPSAPVELTTLKDYRTLRPGEVSFDVAGQPICKDGSTTGRTCGTQLFRNRDGVFSWNLNYIQGDSGGVNYDPRDGSVIGVTSMVLGPLGKAQAADRIVEEAFGIPDGQVNEHFTLAPSNAPHADFLPATEEFGGLEGQINELNRGYVPPNPNEKLDQAIANAQADANRVAQDAARGQFNPAEVGNLAGQHVGEITRWAQLSVAHSFGAL